MNVMMRIVGSVALLGCSVVVHGHGNVTPQGVDLRGLETLGEGRSCLLYTTVAANDMQNART